MKNVILGLSVIVLITVPVFLFAPKKAAFSGADNEAEEMITVLHPDYKPWFSSIWEPPSPEIESLLFSLQAAMGAGLFSYYIGYIKGRKQGIEIGKKAHASD